MTAAERETGHQAEHDELLAYVLPTPSASWARHAYTRCAFSGAGNCCCGDPVESVVHPHPFTAMRVDPLRCVCLLPPNHNIHSGVSRG